MATELVTDGPRTWSMQRDSEGHRTYKITWLVRGDTTDGPFNVLTTPGLPLPGAAWSFDSDLDIWAWCRPDAAVKPLQEDEPNTFWEVEQTFSTKPLQRCGDASIEDPLLEPPKISGSFIKFTEEATKDRFGEPILNSAHELLRGPKVEFDNNRPTVKIEMNVAILDLDLVGGMIDTVNDSTLWGLPSRTIKLSNFSWERRFHGLCNVYYALVFEFEINERTFDRDVVDEGTKVLYGHWNPKSGTWVLDPVGVDNDTGEFIYGDKDEPNDFMRFQDRKGNLARVMLNGAGLPAETQYGSGTIGDTETGEIGSIHVEKYSESNFLLLGIPLIL